MVYFLSTGEQNLLIRNVQVVDDGFYDCQVLEPHLRLRSRRAYLNVTGNAIVALVLLHIL